MTLLPLELVLLLALVSMTVRKTDLLTGGGEFLRRWTRSVRFAVGGGGGGTSGAGRCRIKGSVAAKVVVSMVVSFADFPRDAGSDDGEEGGEMFSPSGASELHNTCASDDKNADDADDDDDGG